MVGLPARGKTYMSKKLTRYLNWIGMPTKGTGRSLKHMLTHVDKLENDNQADPVSRHVPLCFILMLTEVDIVRLKSHPSLAQYSCLSV